MSSQPPHCPRRTGAPSPSGDRRQRDAYLYEVGPVGSVGGALSADGELIAYSDSVGVGAAMLVAEVDTGRVIETSQGVGDLVFSADGRFVSVTDDADDTSPVPGEPGRVQGALVIDRSDHSIRRISVTAGGVAVDNGAFVADLGADGRTRAPPRRLLLGGGDGAG